jgi:hypothetical protein
VNGAAIFTRVIVKPQANWPDYVFRKNYRLPALDRLEVYVNTHHHLPGIVSEDEVRRTGIDVSVQQTAMLRKVEELTLYLIKENKALTEQNKQLSEQNTRLENLEKQVDELKALIGQKTK